MTCGGCSSSPSALGDRPSAREAAALAAEAERLGLPVEPIEPEALLERVDPATRRSNPQGVLLEAGPLPAVALDDALADAGRGPRCFVVLDEVEDPQNVGALIRVAEAAGTAALVLPERRSPPLGPAVARASAGALEWLPVVQVGNLGRALDRMREDGLWVVGADVDAEASLFEVPDSILTGALAVVLGAEGRGLRTSIRQRVDHPVSIPMMGKVGSLNVSTAAAVLLYDLLRRRGSAGGGPGPGAADRE